MKTILLLICLQLLTGCSVVSNNRVFPKLTWYWSRDADLQRSEQRNSWLMHELVARDTKVVDLIGVGERLVDKFGKRHALETVTECWRLESYGSPVAKASDVIWLVNQTPRVQELAWMLTFQKEWLK